MMGIARTVGQAIGIRFAPDNHVVPVLHLGRYRRLEGPGFFRITPGLEAVLEPISIGIRTGRFVFTEVMTSDNIAFDVQMCVRFVHDPRKALRQIQSRIVRIPPAGLLGVVQDRTEQVLRRRVSTFRADELCGHVAQHRIECSVVRYLESELKGLGIVLADNGVILGQLTAPALFKQTMLQARRHQQIIDVLAACENADVAERAIRAEFLNGLESHNGNLTFMSPLEGVMNMNGRQNKHYVNGNGSIAAD